MKHLYLDCISGASGDMLLGALFDLGLDFTAWEQGIKKLGLADSFHVHLHKTHRRHISGTKFEVHESHADTHAHADAHSHSHSHSPEATHAHGHDHGHHHEGHGHEHTHAHNRTFAEIRTLIQNSTLTDPVKNRSVSAFQRIALAEGKIHGMPPEEVHFHEVGALDSIIDLVGFCLGIEMLGIERVFASPLTEGRGWVECAHGRFPVPTPATLEILRGIPLQTVDDPHEWITPTGAALLAEFADSFGPMPAMRIEKTGYGIGTRDPASRPNVLRAILGTLENPAGLESDTVAVIETNLDDCTGESLGFVQELLLREGALDVQMLPAQMKKNRPGILMSVICDQDKAASLSKLILKHTGAFGVRLTEARRLKLRRETVICDTPHGKVEVKLGYHGNDLWQTAPEYESCKSLAEKSGQTLAAIYQAARQAAELKRQG